MLGILLVGVGLLGFVFGYGFGDLWTALVGWFVIDASRSEELGARVARSLDDHTVARADGPAAAQPARVDDRRGRARRVRPATSVEHLLTGFGGAPSALLQTGALRTITDPAAAATLRVRELAITLDRIPAFPPETIARDALQHGVPVVVVARRSDRRRGRTRRGPPRGGRRRGSSRECDHARRGRTAAPDRSKRLS